VGNFYKFDLFYGSNLKISKKIEGSNYNLGKFEGSICNFLENYWGQFEDQNAKFEKNITMKKFKILSF
jgi:hypothetical protein